MKIFYKELLIFSAISILAGSVAVYFSDNSLIYAKNSTSSAAVVTLKSTSAPIIDEAAKERNSAAFTNLKEDLNNYIGSYNRNVGLYYYDLTSGNTIEINTSKEFIAASTVKVPMNMVLLDMVNQGKISLDEKIKYISSDYEAGTGILQGQDLDTPIPLGTLMNYSIQYSDNIATQMIIRTIGKEEMREAIDKKIGHSTDHHQNIYTAADFGLLLKELYANGDKNSYYSQLTAIMKNTIFHDAIDKDIPQNITAHKIGGYESYSNDIAIVYTDKPYILVVLTNEIPHAADKIAGISKIIYDYQVKLK